MDDTVDIDDEGLRKLAATLHERVTKSVSQSTERRDPIPQVVSQFSGMLTFEQWSLQRQEQWCQSPKKKFGS